MRTPRTHYQAPHFACHPPCTPHTSPLHTFIHLPLIQHSPFIPPLILADLESSTPPHLTPPFPSPLSAVIKVIELYQTFNVRFGVMTVGPTGGGKTECTRALQSAMTDLRNGEHEDPNYQVPERIYSLITWKLCYMLLAVGLLRVTDWLLHVVAWLARCRRVVSYL